MRQATAVVQRHVTLAWPLTNKQRNLYYGIKLFNLWQKCVYLCSVPSLIVEEKILLNHI